MGDLNDICFLVNISCGYAERGSWLFCQSGIQKGKGLDLGEEPPVPKLVEYPPPLRVLFSQTKKKQ